MSHVMNRDVHSVVLSMQLPSDFFPAERRPWLLETPFGRAQALFEEGDVLGAAAPGRYAERQPHPEAVIADSRKIRILVVDDHRVLRQGLATMLTEEPDFEVVAEAGDGLEAVALADNLPILDVVLMDITMPRLNGIEATRRILAAHPTIRVIGLSMYEEDLVGAEMRAAGAMAYLSKAGDPEHLLAAIRQVSITPTPDGLQ